MFHFASLSDVTLTQSGPQLLAFHGDFWRFSNSGSDSYNGEISAHLRIYAFICGAFYDN